MMPIYGALGASGPPLFFFKGYKIPYKEVLRDYDVIYETYHCSEKSPKGCWIHYSSREELVDRVDTAELQNNNELQ